MKQSIIPAAVGVDIGCGVSGIRTSLTVHDLPDNLGPLRAAVEAAIPVGSKGHARSINFRQLGLERGLDQLWSRYRNLTTGYRDREGKASRELATLGSGNHFIELCLDAEDRVWLTLHSGSRNAGKEIGMRHIEIAMNLPQNKDLPDPELSMFVTGTPEMDAYRRDLEWAQEYAMRSRSVMMGLFKNELQALYPKRQITFDHELNCHHNYVAEEEIDGQRMLVTRKGAIRAGAGDLALIPGSMGTGSFVVRGLGNPASFQSASHGAGRKMSRSQAKDLFTMADVESQLAGIESRKDAGIIDELPGAYKDILSVMAAQSDLVDVVQHLRTIMCVKG